MPLNLRLISNRVVLRAPHPDDCNRYMELSLVMGFSPASPVPVCIDLETTKTGITELRHEMQSGSSLTFSILQAGYQDRVIGACKLYHMDHSSSRAELAFAMLPKYRRHGFMRESLLTLIRFGFGELSLRRIETEVECQNDRSIRCLERIGFQLEGRLRERWLKFGQPIDTLWYGLLSHELREFYVVQTN